MSTLEQVTKQHRHHNNARADRPAVRTDEPAQYARAAYRVAEMVAAVELMRRRVSR